MEDKNPPYQFFPCNFYKRNNLPQNFLTFSFDPFAKVMWSLKAIPRANPKLLNLNQEHPSKKLLFWLKSLWSFCYDNFSHRDASVTKLWLHDHIYNTIWATW